jgi:hypothetical protein
LAKKVPHFLAHFYVWTGFPQQRVFADESAPGSLAGKTERVGSLLSWRGARNLVRRLIPSLWTELAGSDFQLFRLGTGSTCSSNMGIGKRKEGVSWF